MSGKPQKPAVEGKIPAVGRLRVVAGCRIRRRKGQRKVGTRRRRRGADEEEGMGRMRRGVVVVGEIRRILPRQGGCGGGGGGAQMGTPLLLGFFDQIKPDRIRSKQDQETLMLITVILRWETWGPVKGGFIHGGVKFVMVKFGKGHGWSVKTFWHFVYTF